MKIFLDTNVILDYLTGREPFADDAEEVVAVCSQVGNFVNSKIRVYTPREFLREITNA